MADPENRPYLLGLDLGVQSVGWVILDLDENGCPNGIRRAGVRCFDSGVGSERQIELGKDESGNAKRRQARLQRRQLWRRARRAARVFHTLQAAGLLPAGEARTGEQRHEILKKLDGELVVQFGLLGNRVTAHLLPYQLRAKALDGPLPAHALGRALYHLAQRRGFLSNRKSQKEEKQAGEVKAGIADLQKRMAAAGARTLGEYFAGIDPEEQRIRAQWTDRNTMLIPEFEAIYAAQCAHHSALVPEFQKRLFEAIFFQRPLKSQKSLIGWCELERGHRRAPIACIDAQRFRYLQKLNDLEIYAPDGQILRPSPEQRSAFCEELEKRGEIKFDALRKLWRLKKPTDSEPGHTFNLERGGEKELKGNRTNAKLVKLLGKRWEEMPHETRDRLVDDLIEYEKRDALAKRLVRVYQLPDDVAANLADLTLESGYCALSRAAIHEVLPLMEQGFPYATVRKRIYGERLGGGEGIDLLPPLAKALPNLRNPVVSRGLTELRKVVNALVRRYGKPHLSRVELARDLKRSRSERERLTKENRDNQSAREKAKKKILAEMGNDDPRPGDILKVLLAEESNWECPYTGKAFGMADLIGPSPQFDVEHIIPFSRSLDNSFQNKTLCEIAENRNAKRNRTPFQAYSGSPDKYADILRRVARFRGSAARAKLRRFRMEEIPNDFVDRQLNDTRYMSRLAGDYLGLLYGGQIDSSNKRRVQVSAGRITAFLRDEWGLDAILAGGQARDAIPPSPDDRRKNRADHRHHAVDAAVIGLVDPGTVQLLSRAAERAEEMGRRLFARVDRPWQGFEERVRAAIDSINVSYRVDRRVTGPLHDATFYSEPHVELDENGKPVEYRYVRKRLEDLTESMIEVIMDPKVKGVDPKVKGLVKAKLEQCGGDLKKAFADRNDHPYFRTRDGRVIGIHKVRVRERLTTITLGTPGHERHVAPGTNHHVEILEETDAKGRKRWVDELVSLFEAARRVRCGEPVVRRNHGEGRQFVFSLAKDEYVEMDWEGARSLFRVVSVSKGDIEFHLHTDARPTIVKGRKRIRVRSPSSLLKANARKVTVDPLGNVLPAND